MSVGGFPTSGSCGRARGLRLAQGFYRFARDESGATAIEYTLVAVLIAVVVATTVQLMGTSLNTRLSAAINLFG